MQKWEYLHVSWGDSGIRIWPGEKLDVEWLKDWVAQTFPVPPGATMIQVRGDPRYPSREWYGVRSLHIRGCSSLDSAVAITLIQHLGSEGWEAININPSVAWFKRPISGQRSTTEAEKSMT